MDMTTTTEGTVQARHRLAAAAGAALLAAGLILVLFILPAEYTVDPTGVGARLGLLNLGVVGQQVEALNASTPAGEAQAVVVAAQEKPFNQEAVSFTLAPRGSIEYKYRLENGETLLFSWQATGAVEYEFHAEPDGAPRGYAQTYEKSNGRQVAGTLTAPFSGIHGWYWENASDQPVTVTLTSAGFYNLSHEFRTDEPVRNKTFP